MKKLLLSIASFLTVAAIYGQEVRESREAGVRINQTMQAGTRNLNKPIHTEAKGDNELEVFWSEDFSNGLDGEGQNGAWTTGGEQGDLWFYTLPEGVENGYDSEAALPEEYQDVYGLKIPNWAFGYDIALDSETADNGYMMMDADRWNSTAEVGDETGNATTLVNQVHASLTSPAFALTDVENAYLTFHQDWRACCSDFNITAEFSTDDGLSWVIWDLFELYEGSINNPEMGNVALNISEILESAEDLSACRVRFQWNPSMLEGMTHYYLSIDDVAITAIPENDLVAGETWYQNYFEYLDDETFLDKDYLGDLEYLFHPQFVREPFNFACVVTNAGTETQTGVQLVATINSPDDTFVAETFFSDPIIQLEPGESDTLRAYDIMPDMWNAPIGGVYTINYTVSQNENEQRPSDNNGESIQFLVTGIDEEPYQQNHFNVITNYPIEGQDWIYGTRFVFEDITDQEPIVITHVEFVLQSGANVQTQPGEVCYVNVRKGGVLEEESAENEMLRYFGDEELEYAVEAEDITSGNDEVNWISYELPTPILIDPNTIYQAELELPAVGEDVIFIGFSNAQEPYTGVLYDFNNVSGGPQGWFVYGQGIVPMLRFRLNFVSALSTVSYESGLKLTQNYPNPFSSSTNIQFQLDQDGEVRIEIYDITGKLVRQKRLGMIPANSVQVVEIQRANLAPGTYTYQIISGDSRLTRKMMILD